MSVDSIAWLLVVAVLAGAAGGLSFGYVFARFVGSRVDARLAHWENEVDRINAEEHRQ